jgi:hypothetical protein
MWRHRRLTCSSRTTQLCTSVRLYSRSPSTVACPRKESNWAWGLRLAVVPSSQIWIHWQHLAPFHLRLWARSRNMLLLCRVMLSMMLSRDTYGQTSSAGQTGKQAAHENM